MRLTVRVIPRARHRAIEQMPDGLLRVKVTEPTEGGRANEAVIEALAGHFHVTKRSVRIVRGMTSRTKMVEVIHEV